MLLNRTSGDPVGFTVLGIMAIDKNAITSVSSRQIFGVFMGRMHKATFAARFTFETSNPRSYIFQHVPVALQLLNCLFKPPNKYPAMVVHVIC